MTAAQLLSRQLTADRRARDLNPAVRALTADRWAVESARRDVTYLLSADRNGLHCSCPCGTALPCYHKSAVLSLATETPEPTPPAAPAVAVPCHVCRNTTLGTMCPCCAGSRWIQIAA